MEQTTKEVKMVFYLVALILVVATIGIAGANVLDKTQDDQTSGSAAYNVTGYGLEAQEELGSQPGVIIFYTVIAIIILLLELEI